MDAKLDVGGFKALRKFVRTLEEEVPKKVLSPAMGAGMKVIVTEQRKILRNWAKTRQRTGKKRMQKLAMLLKVRTSKTRRSSQYYAKFSRLPTRDELAAKGLQSAKGYLPGAIEYGFTDRKTSGSMTAVKYLRGGFDNKKREAFFVTMRGIGTGIDKIDRKTKR